MFTIRSGEDWLVRRDWDDLATLIKLQLSFGPLQLSQFNLKDGFLEFWSSKFRTIPSCYIEIELYPSLRIIFVRFRSSGAAVRVKFYAFSAILLKLPVEPFCLAEILGGARLEEQSGLESFMTDCRENLAMSAEVNVYTQPIWFLLSKRLLLFELGRYWLLWCILLYAPESLGA